MFFADSAGRTGPVIREVFECCAGRDTVFRISLCRIIYVSADDANILFHDNVFNLYCFLASVVPGITLNFSFEQIDFMLFMIIFRGI